MLDLLEEELVQEVVVVVGVALCGWREPGDAVMVSCSLPALIALINKRFSPVRACPTLTLLAQLTVIM